MATSSSRSPNNDREIDLAGLGVPSGILVWRVVYKTVMNLLVVSLLVAIVGLLAIPTAVFCVEVIAAIALPHRQLAIRAGNGARRRLAILVPAHNESRGLLPTLADIQSQLLPNDRLLVVADNCTDDTAAVATGGGAEVVERHDAAKRGKGYALDYGLQHLSLDPPEIVIVIDADCRVEDGTVDQLALTCAATGQPVQAVNTMISPTASPVNHQIAEFAGHVKRWLRPLGLSALRLPCPLTGTGMAFPWEAVRSVDLNSGSIAEDLKLGLELALAGYSPIFCPSARVTSEFPSSIKGTRTQRKRWEQGHIEMILNDAPRLFFLAITRCNWRLLLLTLDMAVPPLSLFVTLITGVFAASALAVFFGFSSAPLIISTATLLGFIVANFLAWLKCGRDVLPASAIFSIVPYVLGKLELYRQILSGKANAQWDRTDRKKSE
jgi:cellulose synthase/poly-beta-1,6-N-acetylglucosamine synthase-like glycosyltransferase